MSIFQEYEEIRDRIGHEKYDMIEKYLDIVCSKENLNKYYEELNKAIKEDSTTKWNDIDKALKQKYGIILLDDVLYKRKEWSKYECWYNENCLHRNIKILNTWICDLEYLKCHAVLYENEKEVADIIESYEEVDLRYSIGNKDSELSNSFIESACKYLIFNKFDNYVKLPKISECSKLLQSIYDDVCSSDSNMCYITEDDWKEFYLDEYSEEDFKTLEKEIEKYGLEDVVVTYDGEYKIIGYGDLDTYFNDDRNLNLENEYEDEGSIEL